LVVCVLCIIIPGNIFVEQTEEALLRLMNMADQSGSYCYRASVGECRQLLRV